MCKINAKKNTVTAVTCDVVGCINRLYGCCKLKKLKICQNGVCESYKSKDSRQPNNESALKGLGRETKEHCETCLFYNKQSVDLDGIGIGMCRVRAPGCSGLSGDAVWPLVSILDWCGSHKIDENKI